VGFIVSNFHLLQYGIYEFTLIKSKYVAAGVLYFAIITIGSLPVWILGIGLNPPSVVVIRRFLEDAVLSLDPEMSLDKMKERVIAKAASYKAYGMKLKHWNIADAKALREWKPAPDRAPKDAIVSFLLPRLRPRYRVHIVIYVIVCAIFVAPGVLALNKLVEGMPFMGGNTWWQAAKVSLPIWSLFILFLFVRIAQPLTLEVKGPRGTPLVSEWAAKFLVILAAVLSLFWFTERFYPNVPQGFGGGEPIPIQLSVEDAQLQELMPLTAGSLTDPVLLLEETNSSYIILSDLRSSGELIPIKVSTLETKFFQVFHRDVGVGWRLKPRLRLQSPPSGTYN
jgi:hypothetical protein